MKYVPSFRKLAFWFNSVLEFGIESFSVPLMDDSCFKVQRALDAWHCRIVSKTQGPSLSPPKIVHSPIIGPYRPKGTLIVGTPMLKAPGLTRLRSTQSEGT